MNDSEVNKMVLAMMAYEKSVGHNGAKKDTQQIN